MKYIGRYEVERKLGQGAMGVVLLARDPKLDRPVAIKTFNVEDAPNEDEWQWLRERLLAEGSRAGCLDHNNIVKVFDVQEEGDLAYIVMEYVSGVTLDEYLRTHGTPSQDIILRFLRQTAAGLDYAHSKGIIHRDIKPGNLMVDDDGNIKITDFGIAKRAGSATQTGRMMGTPEFMAPEQIEATSEVDGRADQFSLATLAYLLLTGRKAFDAPTLASLSHQIVTKDPTPPSRANPQLSPAVDSVFRKAMAKSPAGRYRNCLEFIEDLEHSLYAVVTPRSHLIPILIVLLVGVALAGVAVYIYTRHPNLAQVTLSADASEIQQGGQAVLRWTSQYAQRVEITPDIGVVEASGSRAVRPEITTTYQITAYGSKDERTATWTVTVTQPPPHVDTGNTGTGTVIPVIKEPPPHFSVSIAARGNPVKPGQTFSEDDPNLGDLGMKQLTCTVHGSGSIPKTIGLKLVWFLDGQPMTEDRTITKSDLEKAIPYGNMPDTGSYRVRLTGRGVHDEVSFTIAKRPQIAKKPQ